MKASKPNNIIAIVALAFLGFYLMGVLDPNNWWGTHFIAFLPTPWKYGLLALSTIFVGLSFSSFGEKLGNMFDFFSKLPAIVAIPAIGLFMAVMFYFFPIFHDYYGDAFEYEGLLNSQIASISEFSLNPLFSLDLSPHMGRVSMASLVNVLSYVFKLNYHEVFVWMDIVCGSLFVLLWLRFIYQKIKSNTWKIILGMAGLSAPFMQIFFGHVEMYAPSILLLEIWVMLLISFIEKKQQWKLYVLFPLMIIGIKLHPTFLLLLPVWLMIFIAHIRPSAQLSKKLFTWKGLATFILAPVFAMGLILYFFILGDHKDPRTLQGAQDFERLFLPLVSPEPPLDRYNMQSFNHIFDFFNIILHWSPIALIVLTTILIGFRKKVNWEKPEILVLSLLLILYTLFLFAVNPLLSMQIDWDLFMIPAPLLLIFVALLVKEMEEEITIAHKIIPIALGIATLTIPFFAVNAMANPYSQRLESLSIRIFKTYNIWADKYLEYAVKLTSSGEEYITRKQAVIDELKPYAIIGNDLHYAQMIAFNGLFYLHSGNAENTEKARACFQEAYYYYPSLKSNILNLLQANFKVGKFQEAYMNATELVNLKYPDTRKSRRMAIHCALEAQLYEEASHHSEIYLEIFPQDSVIAKINRGLESGENLPDLKNLFAQSKKEIRN